MTRVTVKIRHATPSYLKDSSDLLNRLKPPKTPRMPGGTLNKILNRSQACPYRCPWRILISAPYALK